MLTPRERAAGEYDVAMAQGRRRIVGVDDLVGVTEERVAGVRRAERAIRAALGSERHFLREPDDERLAQMREFDGELAESLEDDATRWAATGQA